ncbi:VOC family protein [Vaginella massiliensis]|uniref:hypothetical protein n=1 Tax=Vaginella massiliensis TaxID=1816680 RepID=UPI0012B5D976|nr:hypothetical protein [Vaginella massiliensis]
MGSSVLMGSDCGGDWSPTFKQGNNFSVAITADSKEGNAIFNALAVGGIITMPLDETFWGDYFGMLIDKFGIN